LGLLIPALFAALEYVVANSIGLPTLVGLAAAVQVAFVAALVVVLGGVRVSGRGL
jgi:hypothetical protein